MKLSEWISRNIGLATYIKSAAWVFFEKIIRLISTLVIGVFVIRYLGPLDYGVYSYALSLVSIFYVISSLGVDGVLVKEFLNNPDHENTILGTALVIKLAASLVLFLIVCVLVFYTSIDKKSGSILTFLSLSMFFQSFNVLDVYYQAKILSKYAVWANLCSVICSSVIKLYMIKAGCSVYYFALVFVIESAIVAFGLICLYAKLNKSILHWRFDGSIAKRILHDSWPLLIGSVAAIMYMKIDAVMIMSILGSESVGYYSVATNFADLWLIITVTITKIFYPSIINAKINSEELYILRLKVLYGFLVKIAVAICIAISIFSDEIIHILYGSDFVISAMVLKLYIWSIVFVYISNASTVYFLVNSLKYHASLRLIIGAFLNIFLNLIWIEKYGLVGAVWATFISYFISSYLYNMFFKSTMLNFKLQSMAFLNVFNPRSYFIFQNLK